MEISFTWNQCMYSLLKDVNCLSHFNTSILCYQAFKQYSYYTGEDS